MAFSEHQLMVKFFPFQLGLLKHFVDDEIIAVWTIWQHVTCSRLLLFGCVDTFAALSLFQGQCQDNKPMITGALPRKNLQFDGLLPGHANTILRAVKVNDFKMICLRNPWGHCEWKGPWHDEGEEWKLHPEVADALQVEDKDNGSFWMEWEDFEWNYAMIHLTLFSVRTSQPKNQWERLALHNLKIQMSSFLCYAWTFHCIFLRKWINVITVFVAKPHPSAA